MPSRQGAYCGIGLLVALAFALRFIHLDADPHFPTWTQYVVDEGRWNAGARNFALFDSSAMSRLEQVHLMLSPGYQAVNCAVFRLFGVDFWSARVFAAASGALIVLAAFVTLRRHVTIFALALGLAILAFETDLLAESRLALPEVPSLLFILLAFLVLVLRPKTPGNAFIAGLLALAAAAIKATSVLVVPALPLIVLLVPGGGPARKRMMRVAAFVGGMALPMVIGLGAILAFATLDTKAVASMGARILGFLAVADPRFVVWRSFESTQLEIRNLLLLGAWFCSWFWICRDAKANAVTRELYLASGLWALWWLVLWSVNDYSPGRYVVHFAVPATIHLMAGLSLGSGETFARLAGLLTRTKGSARAAALAWLVLPSAIFLSTVLLGLGEHAGLDLARVSVRVTFIVAIATVLAAVAHRARAERAVAGFLAFPVTIALVWLGGRELGAFQHFWSFASGASLALWAAVSTLTAVACGILAPRLEAAEWKTRVQYAVVVCVAAVYLAQGVHPVLAPTYSIRDASRRIERDFPNASQIRTISASSMFLGNRLRFRELARDETGYDLLVMFEHNMSSQRLLASPKAARFERVATYPVIFHPWYAFDESKSGPASIGVFVPK